MDLDQQNTHASLLLRLIFVSQGSTPSAAPGGRYRSHSGARWKTARQEGRGETPVIKKNSYNLKLDRNNLQIMDVSNVDFPIELVHF